MRRLSMLRRVTLVLLAMSAGLGVLPVPSAHAAATTLTLSPSAKSVTVGQTFTVRLLVNAGQPINAAEATLSFTAGLLEVQSISKAGSVFTLWAADPSFNNSSGRITFAGGLPSPGYNRSGGTIFTVTFKARAQGSARVTIGGAQVTANDGQGTNVLAGTGSGTYTIGAAAAPPSPTPTPVPAPTLSFPSPTITSDSHPDQETWYANAGAQARWSAGNGVIGYTAIFDQTAGTVPPDNGGSSTTSFSRADLADGVWYLHVRAQYPQGWSTTRHHMFRIDRTQPDAFDLTVEKTSPTSRTVSLTFAATDATSGIDHYELVVNGGDPTQVTSPYELKDLMPGHYDFALRAIDKAGNSREARGEADVVGPDAPVFFLINGQTTVIGFASDLPVIQAGQSLRLRGFANITDRLIIIVRSTESVFEFPVAEIVDPDPIEPAPTGLTAWVVEISPDLSPGVHEIHVSTVNAEGVASSEAPVLKFRVVTDALVIGGTVISYRLIVLTLMAITAFLFLVVAALVFLVIRLHRIIGTTGSGKKKRRP